MEVVSVSQWGIFACLKYWGPDNLIRKGDSVRQKREYRPLTYEETANALG